MPVLIDYIDAIARRARRDVLYLEFHDCDTWRHFRPEDDPMRAAVLDWLDHRGIAWGPCGPIADGATVERYLGQVYVDTPYDATSPAYAALRDYLEHADGTMRHPGVRFCVMPLAWANRNAAHDTPGYWTRVDEQS